MRTSESITLDQFPVGSLVSNASREIIYCNSYFAQKYGYTVNELIGMDFFSLLSRASQIMYDSYLMPLLLREGCCEEIRLTMITSASEPIPAVVSARLDNNDERRIFWSVGHAARSEQLFGELTEARKLLQQKVSLLHTLSNTDQLTGLPNRTALTRHLSQKIEEMKSGELAFALAFLDLDGFKEVNDRYGHDTGDKVLRLVAKRMTSNLRSDDLIARFGGDEFVILLHGRFNAGMAEESLNRLIRQIEEPLKIDSLTLQVSASVGVTLYPQAESITPDQLLRQADQAMYQSKLAGRNQLSLFNVDNEKHQKERHAELLAIKAAMAANEFELYYQPKVNMSSGELLGVEALIRWNHPVEGLKAPVTFLPIITETQVGLDLGQWVISSALEQLQTWLSEGLDVHVSVNISGYHLQHPEFLSNLTRALATFPDVPKHRFEIEVLETSAIEDVEKVSLVLSSCRMMGIRVSLDDFGTGYSTLAHLRDLSVDMLKIDRSFIKDMLTSPGDLAILRGVIGFARAFQCDVVAEGVETYQHAQSLISLGCDWGQGYYIARPIPASILAEWVTDWINTGFHKKFSRPPVLPITELKE
ncbi:EAL domain-containing protein [Marinobacter sp.]|uniref:sensor domain-containing protein n=1 Tax=Marinobacter sp. TaxID=50741 RepID=UPI0019D8AC81|nr:EAL domain-containing protein [Marinobacter sp.]MBE0486354.1 EAL domain-containing protein [Marinobacter sp.]